MKILRHQEETRTKTGKKTMNKKNRNIQSEIPLEGYQRTMMTRICEKMSKIALHTG